MECTVGSPGLEEEADDQYRDDVVPVSVSISILQTE